MHHAASDHTSDQREDDEDDGGDQEHREAGRDAQVVHAEQVRWSFCQRTHIHSPPITTARPTTTPRTIQAVRRADALT